MPTSEPEVPGVKAVLFDFFGTLVEYQPNRAKVASPETYRHACSLGFQANHDTFVRVWDQASSDLERSSSATLREFSMTDAALAFSEAADLDLTLDDAQALGRSYVDEWSQHIHPIPGVDHMIQQLSSRLTVAVVSNTHDPDMVPNILNEMGVREAVSAVVLSVEHGHPKPHPSIYSAALERVGCTADDAVFVGDNYQADYLGPINAGMSAFLIDPASAHDVPPSARVTSVLDVASRIDTLSRIDNRNAGSSNQPPTP